MRKNLFIFIITSVGILSISYAASLVKVMETQPYSALYIYLRFFLVGWVISSIVIAIAGDTKKIGGVKAFLISLFNPALGLIMVLASERKDSEQEMSHANINYRNNPSKPKQTSLKNTSYTLNS